MTEQQTAPAKANRAYRSIPVGAAGSTLAAMAAFAASSLDEPVAVGGAAVAIALIQAMKATDGEWSGELECGVEEDWVGTHGDKRL